MIFAGFRYFDLDIHKQVHVLPCALPSAPVGTCRRTYGEARNQSRCRDIVAVSNPAEPKYACLASIQQLNSWRTQVVCREYPLLERARRVVRRLTLLPSLLSCTLIIIHYRWVGCFVRGLTLCLHRGWLVSAPPTCESRLGVKCCDFNLVQPVLVIQPGSVLHRGHE